MGRGSAYKAAICGVLCVHGQSRWAERRVIVGLAAGRRWPGYGSTTRGCRTAFRTAYTLGTLLLLLLLLLLRAASGWQRVCGAVIRWRLALPCPAQHAEPLPSAWRMVLAHAVHGNYPGARRAAAAAGGRRALHQRSMGTTRQQGQIESGRRGDQLCFTFLGEGKGGGGLINGLSPCVTLRHRRWRGRGVPNTYM